MIDRRRTVFRLSLGYEHFLQGYKAAKSPASYAKFLQGFKGPSDSNYYALFDNVVVASEFSLSPMSPERAGSARSRRFLSVRAERALYPSRSPRIVKEKKKEDVWEKTDFTPAPNQVTTLKWRNAAALALDKRVNKSVVFAADENLQDRQSKTVRIVLNEDVKEPRSRPSRPARNTRMRHASFAWDSVFNKVCDDGWKNPKNQDTMQRKKRDACNSLRMLIFGCLLNENNSIRDQNKIYEETCGSKDQVKKLWELWKRIDTDGSGDVDLDEFMKFFSANKSDRLLSWRAVQYLVHNSRTATIEDFMRLTWPKAEDEHVAIMIQYFRESAADDQRVPSPRLISRKIRRELRETFRDLDCDGSQQISFDEMVEAGLVDKDTANSLIKQFDTNGDGCIDEREFLEMMAPNGRIAFEDQRECVDINGNVIEYVKNLWFQGWRLKDAPSLPYNLQD